MNKLKSMNKRGQTLATKVLQKDHLDFVEDSTIRTISNIRIIIDDIFTTNQLKELIKKTIINQVESSVQPSYSYTTPYTQMTDLLKMPLNYQTPKF